MITFSDTTDARYIYRETSSLSALKMDRTGDTGSLLNVLRDATLVIGCPGAPLSDEKIPERPEGSLEAVSV